MPGSNIIVGLDLGTTKVSVVIAEITEENDINIVGVADEPVNRGS